jgi:hypothetical protein
MHLVCPSAPVPTDAELLETWKFLSSMADIRVIEECAPCAADDGICKAQWVKLYEDAPPGKVPEWGRILAQRCSITDAHWEHGAACAEHPKAGVSVKAAAIKCIYHHGRPPAPVVAAVAAPPPPSEPWVNATFDPSPSIGCGCCGCGGRGGRWIGFGAGYALGAGW